MQHDEKVRPGDESPGAAQVAGQAENIVPPTGDTNSTPRRVIDRRPKWKRAVYAKRPGMTNGCRVLLLRLADGMDSKGIVSVPRTTLADDLGVAPARISENIKLARKLGFLDIVRRARPNVTAVYQATIPDVVGTPERIPARGTENRTSQGTPRRTPNDASEVREGPHPSSSGYADSVPTYRSGSSQMTAPHSLQEDSEGDMRDRRQPVPAKPEPSRTENDAAMDGLNDQSQFHPFIHEAGYEPRSRSPWKALQDAYDNGEVDSGELEERLDDLLGGLDDYELRTVTGMLANGAHVKVIYNRVMRDRRMEAAS